MGAEAGCIAGATHVADDKLLLREAHVEFSFQSAVIQIPFGKAVADEYEAFSRSRRCDGLRASYACCGWLVVWGVALGIRVFFCAFLSFGLGRLAGEAGRWTLAE